MYPIKGFSVINAIHKSTPFVLECMVRKRLEKRMEVNLTGVTTYASGSDRAALRLRSVTPQQTLTSSLKSTALTSSRYTTDEMTTLPTSLLETNTNTLVTSNSLIIVGESNQFASEFVHTIQFSGNLDQIEVARNAIALKLVRIQRDKSTGLVTLIFDFIFCPSKSFM